MVKSSLFLLSPSCLLFLSCTQSITLSWSTTELDGTVPYALSLEDLFYIRVRWILHRTHTHVGAHHNVPVQNHTASPNNPRERIRFPPTTTNDDDDDDDENVWVYTIDNAIAAYLEACSRRDLAVVYDPKHFLCVTTTTTPPWEVWFVRVCDVMWMERMTMSASVPQSIAPESRNREF